MKMNILTETKQKKTEQLEWKRKKIEKKYYSQFGKIK